MSPFISKALAYLTSKSSKVLFKHFVMNICDVSSSTSDTIEQGIERKEEFFTDCGIARSFCDVGMWLIEEY